MMLRKAFSLMELVFVIIIIGILAVLAMPNFERQPLEEAAEQVASHIRYTQHLAMIDDKYDVNDAAWYQERWQIRFRLLMGEYGYVIFADNDHNKNSDNAEIATDTLSGELLNGFLNYASGNLTTKYGITAITSSCFQNDGSLVTANKGVIAFDNLGRPYSGVSNATTPAQYLLTTDCNIVLTHSDGTATVTISPETGYVSVSYL